jgi:predicted PurR-regulated permease PerM
MNDIILFLIIIGGFILGMIGIMLISLICTPFKALIKHVKKEKEKASQTYKMGS